MELSAGTVRAAGGLVLRAAADGTHEVLLVHRPKYDDWAFPKGKALHGESDEDCALREVEEETGLRCALGAEVSDSEYVDAAGRQKVVRYWTMEPLDGEFEPGHEVDEARWLPLSDARELLTYDRDRVVLESLDVDHQAGPA